MFSTAIVLGFGQGFQPVCGFNFGARKFSRIRRAFWFSVTGTSIYCAVLSLLGYVFAERVIAIFRPDDPELISLGARALRYECLIYTTVGFVTMSNMFLQNTRKTIRASLLAASRQGIMLFLALHVGNSLFGLNGLAAAQPVADLLTLLVAIPFAFSGLREMK